jgi:hypothetical protein
VRQEKAIMVTVLSGKWARDEGKPRKHRKPEARSVSEEKEKAKRRRALTPEPSSVSVRACGGGLPSLGKKG